MAGLRILPSVPKADTVFKNLTTDFVNNQIIVKDAKGNVIARLTLTLDEQYALKSKLPDKPKDPDPEPEEPDPEPETSSYKGFADTPPGSEFRPYSDKSPFNLKIVNPTIHAQSNAYVANVLKGGIGSLSTSQAPEKDYGHPIYFAKTSDPLLTIDVGSYPISGQKINVPVKAKSAGGDDGHIAIVTPDGWEYGFWRATVSGTTLKASIGARQRYDGLGIVTPEMKKTDKTIGGTTASYFGQHAGIIRGPELASGHIDHALFLVISSGARDQLFGHGAIAPGANGAGGSGSSVYPAYKGDAAGSGVLPPMGARFWLEMTATEIDATGAPTWERTIAKAMAEYGGYFGDTGGPGFAFQFESALAYTALGRSNPFEQVAINTGLKKDPTWGYTFKFSNKINWASKLRVIIPPEK